MIPLLPTLALVAAPALPEWSVAREDVRYANGELQLAAELLRPADAPEPRDRGDLEDPDLPGGSPRRAGLVVLQGSGESDRSNAWSRAFADVAVEAGLVVLLSDKRGCGASQGDWERAGFEDLAADALAGVRFLRALPDVDPERVGVMGLSQGGWVAPVAAARSGDVAFVVDVSGAAVGFLEQVQLEMENTAREAGLSAAGVDVVLGMNRAAYRYLMSGDWGAYAQARAEALESEARSVVAGFPASPDAPQWTFLRHVARFDPMPYWTTVEQPVLVLYGERDELENVPVAESVRRLEHAFRLSRNEDATIRVVPGAGHALLDPGTRQLVPEVVDTLRAWLRAR